MAANYVITTEEQRLSSWLYYASYADDTVEDIKDGLVFSEAMGMYIPNDEDFGLLLNNVKTFAELDLLQLEKGEDEEF